MRYRISASVVLAAALAVSACSPAAEVSEAAEAPAAVAQPAAEVAPTPAPAPTLEAACRQAVETNYGQVGQAVTFEAGAETVSWRAPVDGGRLIFTCALEGDTVTLTRDGQTQVVTLNTSAVQSAQQEAH